MVLLAWRSYGVYPCATKKMIVGAVPLQLMVANVTVFSIHPVVKTPLPPGLVPQMPLAYVATCLLGRDRSQQGFKLVSFGLKRGNFGSI